MMSQGRGAYYASSLHPAYQPFIQPNTGVVAPSFQARGEKALLVPPNDVSKIDQILCLLQSQQ